MKESEMDQLVRASFEVDATPSPEFVAKLASISTVRERSRGRRWLRLSLAAGAICIATAAVFLRFDNADAVFTFKDFGRIELRGMGGAIHILGPHEELLGETGSGDPPGSRTLVRVGNKETEISGLGRHPIFDSDGRLRFILDMEPPTDRLRPVARSSSPAKELQELENQFFVPPTTGVMALPGEVIGSEQTKHLRWRAQGPVDVRFKAAGQTFQASVADAPAKAAPILTWWVDSSEYHATGFGTYVLTDRNRVVVGTVDLSPLKRP